MERYNYIEHLKEDINNFIEENKNLSFDELYDTMFTSDTITGNASGSYTFSTWKAEENICHNQELLIDALTEFGYNFTTIKNLIDMNKPVILSFWKCEKYSNHTITIIGYDDKTQDLIIADNWSKRP